MASEPWGDDAGPFGLLVRQLAERLKPGGPGLPARIVSLAHRVGICHLLARDDLSNARRFVHPTDMAAYDEATVQLETTLVLYLGGAYAAATATAPFWSRRPFLGFPLPPKGKLSLCSAS